VSTPSVLALRTSVRGTPFGGGVHPITHPGQTPAVVNEVNYRVGCAPSYNGKSGDPRGRRWDGRTLKRIAADAA